MLQAGRAFQIVRILVSWFWGTIFCLSFHLWSTLFCQEENCTHTCQPHFRTGKAGNLEDREEPSEGAEDVVLMLSGMLTARLTVDFQFYRLTNKIDTFVKLWGVQGVLCSVMENSLVLNF